ncbi:zinc-finger domain-containing protein [soil metagenome]
MAATDANDTEMTATVASTTQANAQTRYEVHRSDLPLSCPLPAMALWNSHPRVYLPIEADGGSADCPYCSAHFVLVD